MNICAVASGSKGNCIFISDNSTSILIDAGLSAIQIEKRLAQRGLKLTHLDGIIVSHEHLDHIRGVGVLSRRFKIPIYINNQTYEKAQHRLGRLETNIEFECGRSFTVNTLRIHPFSIPHDAVDPSGFTITQGDIKVGIATDLGYVTQLVKKHLANCQVLILEANHDISMLENGQYSWPLKQRIRSKNGHLSNEDSIRLLSDIYNENLEHVIMAHLSEENNSLEKIKQAIQPIQDQKTLQVYIANQNEIGELIKVG